MPEITEFLDPALLPHRQQPKPVFDKNMGYYYGRLPSYNAQLNVFGVQISASAADAAAKAAAAGLSAQQAAAAATDAASLVGAVAWVSGATYAKNAPVISQVNFHTYRRRLAGSGATDPANDPANWAIVTNGGTFLVQENPSATFDLSTGQYFTRAMSASETWVFSNIPSDGFRFTVELAYSGGTLSLPASVKTPDDIVYSFTAGKTYMLMFVTSNRGARFRMVVASNFTT